MVGLELHLFGAPRIERDGVDRDRRAAQDAGAAGLSRSRGPSAWSRGADHAVVARSGCRARPRPASQHPR